MQTIFIPLTLLLLFLLYLAGRKKFLNKENQRRNLVLNASLERVVSRYRLLISELDFFKNEIIALDLKNNQVISILEKRNVISERCFPLAEVQSCRMITEKDQLTGYISRVRLELALPGGEVIDFNFFDEVRDTMKELPSQVRKAKYWKSKIQFHLNRLRQGIKLEYVI